MIDYDIRLILDFIIVMFLFLTLVYVHVLNRRLSAFRKIRADFLQIVGQFSESTKRAEKVLPRIKIFAEKLEEMLEKDYRKTQLLKDDVDFMCSKGETLAKLLEELLQEGKNVTARLTEAKELNLRAVEGEGGLKERDLARNSLGIRREASEIRSKAEQELMEVLKSVRD